MDGPERARELAKRLASWVAPTYAETLATFALAGGLCALAVAGCEVTAGCPSRETEFWLGAAFFLALVSLVVFVSASILRDEGA